MKKTVALLLSVLSASLLMIQSTQAHHSFSQFDQSVQMVIRGEVTRWTFNNPHVWLYVDSEDDSGEMIGWSLEGSGLIPLLKRGIDGNTFKPGDKVTVMFCPLTDGRPGGALGWAIINDEPMISPNDGGCRVSDEGKEQWISWLEKGYTSNLEAEAAGD